MATGRHLMIVPVAFLHGRGARSPQPAKPREITDCAGCVVLIAWAASGLAFPAQRFRDPTPPVVQAPPLMQTPGPKPNPAVRFHAKPKPLPPGAVTTDWKSFMGPTHDAMSAETKL